MNEAARRVIGTTEAAALLGASEASVKRWSDSGVLPCERTPGGHRRFLLSEVESFAVRLRAQPGAPLDVPAVEELSRLALAGDATGIEERLRPRWSGPLQIADLIDGAVGPALALVGQLWEAGQISIADEHVATSTFRTATAALSAGLLRPTGGAAVLACIGEEEHDLAATLGAQALRAAGLDAVVTGARTPVDDVARLVRRLRPRLVGVSVMGAVKRSGSSRDLALLAAAAREVRASLWVGGRGAASLQLPREAHRAQGLRELVAAALSSRGAP